MLDLRIPTGWFFVALGVILIAYGLTVPGAKAPMSPERLNEMAGGVMAVFGGILLALARRSKA